MSEPKNIGDNMAFTGTYTIELDGRTEKPAGLGQRLMTVKCAMSPAKDTAIHAQDVGLRRIVSIGAVNVTSGSLFYFSVVSPGSYNNYASVTMWQLAVADGGTMRRVAVASGTKTYWVRATGD